MRERPKEGEQARERFQPAILPVLVIEDDARLSEGLCTMLESAGYHVACVNSETDIERLSATAWRTPLQRTP
jgi:CheY-like chemotaxis protein